MFKVKVDFYTIEDKRLIDVRWFLVDNLELINMICYDLRDECSFVISMEKVLHSTEGAIEITEEMFNEL